MLIFLTGFMGAGKTTVGKTLGGHLGCPVIDIDEQIIRRTGLSILEIFKTRGEGAFRRLESDALQSLKDDAQLVVTTGGGAVLSADNRGFMKKQGIVVFLHCQPETLRERLAGDTDRPLLLGSGEEDISGMYEERLPLYLTADFTVDTTVKPVTQIAEEIAGFLNRLDS